MSGIAELLAEVDWVIVALLFVVKVIFYSGRKSGEWHNRMCNLCMKTHT